MKLQINNLSKTYSNGVKALNNISLDIPTGMFGLLGPNGAGKSTLMRTLATLQEADSGEAKLGDLDILKDKDELKSVLGYLPQEFGFYPKDSAYDLLMHFALLRGIKGLNERKEKVHFLLKRVNLWEARKQKIGTFSGGMKQRFGIAQALLSNPKLIIVDEPTAGLDPQERNRFHNLLSEIGEQVIIILSTHIVEDVSDLCTNMAIINKGEIILKSSPEKAINTLEGKIWQKEIDKSHLESYEKAYQVISTRLYAGKTIIHVYNDFSPENGFEPIKTTLEDVYFFYLNKENKTELQAV